jgi:hypothetical protein
MSCPATRQLVLTLTHVAISLNFLFLPSGRCFSILLVRSRLTTISIALCARHLRNVNRTLLSYLF